MPERFLTHSTPALIAANAIAVVAAALGGWSLGDLIRLYLIELVAIGVIALLQIRNASKPGALAKSRGYLLIFFVAHYGSFCAMYFAVLPKLAWPDFGPVPSNFWLIVLIPAAALTAAHVISYRFDFLPRESLRVSSMQGMLLPYARELPVHVPLVLAALIRGADAGTPTQIAVIFALGKTALDVFAHIALHRRLTAYSL